MFGEDDTLVHIPTTTHPFDSILGSKESQCPALFLDPLFVMIWPLIIEIWLFTWSYCISTFLPIDLDRHSLHLFDYEFITEPWPLPTCWILVQAIWISGSWIIHHSSDSSVLGEGMSNFTLIFLIICPVLLTTVLPESYTIHLWFKLWVRSNAPFIPEKPPSLLIPFYLGGGSPLYAYLRWRLLKSLDPGLDR